MKEVIIYTDGSSRGNPGPGGYGVVLIYGETRKELSRGFRKTTNNRMELMGAIAGLESLTETCNVQLYSDSKYVVDAINKNWIKNWQRNSWRKKNKAAVLNKDLWILLLAMIKKHNITFTWVKGHSTNQENERCDLLAVEAATTAPDNIDKVYENI